MRHNIFTTVSIVIGGEEIDKVRRLVIEAQRSTDADYNPLPDFNSALDEVIQYAFNAGRECEQYKDKEKS